MQWGMLKRPKDNEKALRNGTQSAAISKSKENVTPSLGALALFFAFKSAARRFLPNRTLAENRLHR